MTLSAVVPAAPSEHHMCAQLPGVMAEASATGADVPGGAVLLDQIEQCDKILLYEGTWWLMQPQWLRPETEVDLCALAAFAVQSESPSMCALPT